MLCSVLLSMCPHNSPSIKYSSSFSSQLPPHQEQSPPASPLSTNMPSEILSPASPNPFSRPMPSITPPWSPPSPTMSMESISGSPLLSDVALQQFSRKIKIMIVDDNSINLTILSRVLHVHFAETVELSAVMTSGVAALERLSKEEFDLILMDIDMPVLTGVQTTIAIRQPTPEYPILEQNQRVPIIAVTTSDDEIQRELYQRVGMSCCVSKPIVVSKLRFAIEDAVNSTGHLAVG